METKRETLTKSFIWGGLAGALLLTIGLFYTFSTETSPLFGVLGSIVAGIAGVTLVSQFFWGEFMLDFFMFFFKTFRAPLLIFTLDLDGIIWFICVKLLFAILGFLLSATIFILGLLLSLALSLFVFPFALTSYLHSY